MSQEEKSEKIKEYGKEYDDAVRSGSVEVYGDMTRDEFIASEMDDHEADRVYGRGNWDR